MVTISDVAQAANVSKKTVSRVINDHPDVADATRQHVQNIITQLGYQPSMLARGLSQGRTNTIAVIINQSADDVFGYPLYSENLRGISSVLSAADFDMLVHFTREDCSYVNLYRQRRVDGLILLSMPMDDPHLEELPSSGAPYVFTQRVKVNGTSTYWVDADFEDGAMQAFDYLFGLGHRRIGFITSPLNKAYTYLLMRGYRKAYQQRGLELPEELIILSQPYVIASQPSIMDLMKQPDPPTAFACSDDMIAIQLIQLLQGMGYDVPGDVSVLGTDDALIARVSTPSLTTIRQDAFRKGSLAAELLIRQIAKQSALDVTEQTLLPMQLIVRASTGPIGTAPRKE